MYLKQTNKQTKNTMLLPFLVDMPLFVKYLKETILKHLNDDTSAVSPKIKINN